MATTYTAFIWPPLIFPLPTNPALLGPAQVSRINPKFPTPAAASARVTFTPATNTIRATIPAATVNPYTTQDQINSFFRISAPRPGTGL